MASTNSPSASFDQLASLPKFIDVSDAPAMARALLRSESLAGTYNALNSALGLNEAPLTSYKSEKSAAPPITVPQGADPAQAVSSMMAQMQARIGGPVETHLAWSAEAYQGGDLKIERRQVDPALYAKQVAAIEHLQTALRDNVVRPMLSNGSMDMFTALPSAGNESASRNAFAGPYADAIRAYQTEINAATQGGAASNKAYVEYQQPANDRTESLLLAQAARVSQRLDEYADSMPTSVGTVKTAPARSAVKPEAN